MNIVFGDHSWVFDIINSLILLASVLVAAGAAVFSIREARRSQERAEMSVAPAINAAHHANETEDILGVQLENVGNGPATIDAIYFVYRDIAIDATAPAWFVEFNELIKRYYKSMEKDLVGLKVIAAGMTKGTVLGAGSKVWLASMVTSRLGQHERQQFQNFVMNSTVVVSYRSVHGRQYDNINPYLPEGNSPKDVPFTVLLARRFPKPPSEKQE